MRRRANRPGSGARGTFRWGAGAPASASAILAIGSMLHHSEVSKHAGKDSLWLIVKGNAYDLTEVRSISTLHFDFRLSCSTTLTALLGPAVRARASRWSSNLAEIRREGCDRGSSYLAAANEHSLISTCRRTQA